MLPSACDRTFDEFGRSVLGPTRRRAGHECDANGTKAETRKLLRAVCPKAPGVYGMLDVDGRLIYVGKSKSLRHRLLSYFQASAEATKAECIIARTSRLIWEPAHHEFAALVRELELIRRWLPRFNVQGKPGRWRHAYLCVGRAPGAYVYLLPKPAASARHVFGPVSGGWKMRRAVERLNDVCRLRDCPDRVPMVFRDQAELFDEVRSPQCMRYELGRCLGPCAALCTSAEYARAARQARKFIDGSDLGPLEAMEADMREAAALRQFERAAMLRDHLADLQYLRDQVARIEHVRKHYTFVYPVDCHDQRQRWYLIRNGYLAGVLRAPTNSEQAARCRRGLQRVFKTNNAVGGASVEEQLDFVRLVSSWFRFRPEELERTITVEEAMARAEGMTLAAKTDRLVGMSNVEIQMTNE